MTGVQTCALPISMPESALGRGGGFRHREAMHDFASKVLWIYIVLLVIGGLIGFLKAKSQVSLIMSVSFAAALSLCAAGVIFQPYVADILLAALLVVFAIRLIKTKKLMPAGLMLIVTTMTLVLRHIHY